LARAPGSISGRHDDLRAREENLFYPFVHCEKRFGDVGRARIRRLSMPEAAAMLEELARTHLIRGSARAAGSFARTALPYPLGHCLDRCTVRSSISLLRMRKASDPRPTMTLGGSAVKRNGPWALLTWRERSFRFRRAWHAV